MISKRENAMDIMYEGVTVLDIPMVFTDLRVDRDTVPDGYYMYEVRHDDESFGDPIQIAKFIIVNHFGTVISSTKLVLEETSPALNAYLDIDPNVHWGYDGIYLKLEDYMKKYPSKNN